MAAETKPSSKAYILPALAAGTVLVSIVALAVSPISAVDENVTIAVSCLFLSVAVLYTSLHNVKACRQAENLDKVDIILKCAPGRNRHAEKEAGPKIKFKLPNH